MENIQVINNIVPTLHKEFFRSADRSIVVQLRNMAYEICRTEIPDTYIKHAFNKFRKGCLFRDDTGDIICFALWNEHELLNKIHGIYRYMYAILICGKRTSYTTGNIIFPYLVDYCKEKSIHSIQLIPANDKLRKYYSDYGFQNLQTHDGMMELPIAPIKLMPRRNTRKNTSNMRRRTTQKRGMSEAAPRIEYNDNNEYNNLEAPNIV